MARSEFIIVPPDQVAGRYRSFKAFSGQRKGKSPYSANAFLDTGANVFLSGAEGMFEYLNERSTSIEGIGDATFTHTGPVTMIIGSETKTFTGYWKKDFEGTIVPGGDFDDRSWWFKARDRILHLCKGETIHGIYPRDIALD